jgi:hypothetical protein
MHFRDVVRDLDSKRSPMLARESALFHLAAVFSSFVLISPSFVSIGPARLPKRDNRAAAYDQVRDQARASELGPRGRGILILTSRRNTRQ